MGRPSKFDADFIERALELVELSERPRCRVAGDLGISDATLAKWMKRSKKTRTQKALTTSERDELIALRGEKREWLMEREILKKATAFWVKESKQ